MSNLELLKKLREETGVGFSSCKKALEETNDDYDKAIDLLRKQGEIKAMSKSDRATTEGLCGIFKDNTGVSCVKLSCETDFVARNEKFQKLASSIAEIALKTKSSSVEELLDQKNNDGRSVKEMITENIAAIGENIVLSDVKVYTLNPGENVSYYVHNCVDGNSDLGKIISFTISKGENNDKTALLLKQINMHIVAMSPMALNENDIPSDVIAKEKAIYEEQVLKLNKPAEIAAKMVEGKIKKFYEENVLLKQIFVIDNKNPIASVIANFNKENNTNIEIVSYTRIAV